MTQETVTINRVVVTPTTDEERKVWLGAKLAEDGAEVTMAQTQMLAKLRFKTPQQIAALEDVLRVLRMRWEDARR